MEVFLGGNEGIGWFDFIVMFISLSGVFCFLDCIYFDVIFNYSLYKVILIE